MLLLRLQERLLPVLLMGGRLLMLRLHTSSCALSSCSGRLHTRPALALLGPCCGCDLWLCCSHWRRCGRRSRRWHMCDRGVRDWCSVSHALGWLCLLLALASLLLLRLLLLSGHLQGCGPGPAGRLLALGPWLGRCTRRVLLALPLGRPGSCLCLLVLRASSSYHLLGWCLQLLLLLLLRLRCNLLPVQGRALWLGLPLLLLLCVCITRCRARNLSWLLWLWGQWRRGLSPAAPGLAPLAHTTFLGCSRGISNRSSHRLLSCCNSSSCLAWPGMRGWGGGRGLGPRRPVLACRLRALRALSSSWLCSCVLSSTGSCVRSCCFAPCSGAPPLAGRPLLLLRLLPHHPALRSRAVTASTRGLTGQGLTVRNSCRSTWPLP